MPERPPRASFEASLDLFVREGRKVRFWLRDDDATGDDPGLARLLEMTGEAGVEPLIAAIPAHSAKDLADILEGRDASVAVHGFAHANHAAKGEKSCELGPDRPTRIILGELVLARELMEDLVGERLLPVLVPPWNRIAPGLVRHLPVIGFEGLSRFGPRGRARPTAGLVEVNTHIDLVDWRGSRRTWPEETLFAALGRAADAARISKFGEPVGILTHHRVHDEEAWGFLRSLFAITLGHPGVQWLGARALFAGTANPAGRIGA